MSIFSYSQPGYKCNYSYSAKQFSVASGYRCLTGPLLHLKAGCRHFTDLHHLVNALKTVKSSSPPWLYNLSFKSQCALNCPSQTYICLSVCLILTGQLKLSDSCVLIVGAGVLGCPAAIYMAAAGIGKYCTRNLIANMSKISLFPFNFNSYITR